VGEMLESIKTKFATIFDSEPTHYAFAPGRINLIGEHTDYNGGYVFPAAIELGTYGLARKREDNKINVYSLNFEEKGIISFDLNNLAYDENHDWANYVKGVIKYLVASFPSINQGFDIVYEGNIPNGASLSSSASIELVSGWLIKSLFDLELDRLTLVKIGQKVENNYIGVNSGIMDQFVIGLGKSEHAILLDTGTLKYDYVPAYFGDYVISIMNTNKRRSLTESKYNERRAECEAALASLQQELTIEHLCDIDIATFERYQYLIDNATNLKRARHAISENERTKQAHEMLSNNQFTAFGQLLNDSHESLKNDYEVTGLELDTLAETAQSIDGVLGARMTGAGFAGCAIALVHKDSVKALEQEVTATYTEKIGYAPSFYHVNISDGVKSLN
jgi:galactokinase